MPSTDIDGSPLVLLSCREGERVYEYLFEISLIRQLDTLEIQLAGKIASSLDLEPIATKAGNALEIREIDRLRTENFRLQHELDRIGMPTTPASTPDEFLSDSI
jgi:hypothetical protein